MSLNRKHGRALLNEIDHQNISNEKEQIISQQRIKNQLKDVHNSENEPAQKKNRLNPSKPATRNREIRIKDVYDISSSENEEPQEIPNKKRKLSSSLMISSTPNLTVNIPKGSCKRSTPTHTSQSLQSVSSKKLKTENRSHQKTSVPNNSRQDSSTLPKVTPIMGRKVAVVEIPSSGSSKALKSLEIKSNNSKIDRRIQLLEEMERDTNTGKKVILPIKPKRRRAKASKATDPFSQGNKGLTSLAQITRSKVSQCVPKHGGCPTNKPPEPLVSSPHEIKVILNSAKTKDSKSFKRPSPKGDKELDFGFKDLPITFSDKKDSTRSHQISNLPMDKSVQHIKEDDTACQICGRYDSKKKNPMLLCDGCDSGYHIRCIGLSKEPETEEWFCKNCKPDQALRRHDQLVTLKSSNSVPEIENFEYHLRHQQRIILDKLTGRERLQLKGLDEEIQKVYQVVEQTVSAGESNSLIIIGSRGTGKSTLVNTILSDLSSQYPDSFHVVRLNGLIHTDDKLSVKEIWRQLGREMKVEGDSALMPINHADTLISLLALLSHSSETFEADSFKTSISVVFILDEFDHFTMHHRQTLLYNLFDIAQSKKAPIIVLGLTTKVDITERLEKRVKSRFSHRYVHLSLPKSLPAFWEICKQGLIATDVNDVKHGSQELSVPGYQEFTSFWRTTVESLYTKDVAFMNHLQCIFYQTKSVPVFFNSCILPMANLSLKNPIVHGEDFHSNALSLSEPDSKLHVLPGLSELELALLIAAGRLDVILDIDTCNFAMAYEEYSSLTSQHKVQSSSSGITAIGSSAKVWGRQICLDAWERLVNYELLIPAGLGTSQSRDYGVAGRMWKVDVGLDEIPGSLEGLSAIMTKWCREI